MNYQDVNVSSEFEENFKRLYDEALKEMDSMYEFDNVGRDPEPTAAIALKPAIHLEPSIDIGPDIHPKPSKDPIDLETGVDRHLDTPPDTASSGLVAARLAKIEACKFKFRYANYNSYH
jgi:hypothetical protein